MAWGRRGGFEMELDRFSQKYIESGIRLPRQSQPVWNRNFFSRNRDTVSGIGEIILEPPASLFCLKPFFV